MIMGKDIFGIGLESSCDETAVSIVKNGKDILSNIIFSQIDLHRIYYGVVPEIASRSHLETMNLLIEKALKEAGIGFADLDYSAATNRPGLVGSLLMGLQSAKVISYTLKIPLIGINHLEAHLYAPFLEGREFFYPFIGLLISGGNTILYNVRGIGDMEIIGKTADDAVGEAFDKVAKFLDIGYPGGPAVENLSKKAVKKNVKLPRILQETEDYRFSYSGIKTAVINYVKENPDIDKAEVVFSFQERALEILSRHVFAAARERSIKNIIVAGGVACNGRLRELLMNNKEEEESVIIPSPVLCTDNAAMVAGLGYQYFMKNRHDNLDVDVKARL